MTIEKTNKQTLLTGSEGDREDCKVTSVDVAMLFLLDVVIVFCIIKLFFYVSFGGSMPQVKDIYEFLVSFEIVNNLLVRFQMTACYKRQSSYAVIGPALRDGLLRCYKSEKKKDFLRLYLHPWFSIFLISTIELILFACK